MLCHILPPLLSVFRCFFDATATADFYTLSLHDALPICPFEPLLLPLEPSLAGPRALQVVADVQAQPAQPLRSEEHTSELQSRQYLVCRLLLEKKKKTM